MATRDTTVRIESHPENSRPAEKSGGDDIRKSVAPARRDCAEQQLSEQFNAATAGSRLVDIVRNVLPFGSEQLLEAGSHSARPPSAVAPLTALLPVPLASVNVTPTSRPPDCDSESEVTRGQTCMLLDTSLRTLLMESVHQFWEIEGEPKYAREIYRYLRDRELKDRPRPKYMQKQLDITSSMRTTLVDWIVAVVTKCNLQEETLFRAVKYVDRFLSRMSAPRRQLQLVGTASLLVAAKIEEIHPPSAEKLACLTHDTYTHKNVIKMERVLLRELSFDLAGPTTNYFLQLYTHVDEAPPKVRHLSQYLCELALLEDEPYLQHLPSVIAGAALCFANQACGKRPWGTELVEYTGYELTDFRECIRSLYKSFSKAPSRSQKTVYEKFKLERFHRVADLEVSPTVPFCGINPEK